MNVLFLSLLDFDSFDERNIYTDLLREFIREKHNVYCISPVERITNRKTQLLRFGNSCVLKLRIGNIQKVNLIEKGLSTLSIEPIFIRGIKRYFSNIKFDLVLYATPPITFERVIRFVKKRDGAKSYLMLKDIFPQNSVDLGMLSKTGLKGLIYSYFRNKEKRLYAISDHIGCMSPANVAYILEHNPEIPADKVGLCPNCVDIQDLKLDEARRAEMRLKYEIPRNKKVFVYGGNLGKPQDVPFIVNCLRECSTLKDVFFVIAGSGTERRVLEEYVAKEQPHHVKLLEQLPKSEYDKMIACCDVGLIFLDHRFTIPNFPSRLLSYMQAGLPVLACTDPNTDIGKTITEGGFGWWCESNTTDGFLKVVSILQDACLKEKENEENYLMKHYSTTKVYKEMSKTLDVRG